MLILNNMEAEATFIEEVTYFKTKNYFVTYLTHKLSNFI